MTTSSPLLAVIAALERLGLRFKHHGDQVDAQCPAHDDQAPSLSVTYNRATGKVLVNCHVGCAPDVVLAALGLTWSQLFDTTPEDEDRVRRPEIVATYPYCDEGGTVLFEKVRYHPKDFRVRRPDGRGGWTWKLGDTRRVLYRLPELNAAITAGKPVLLTEGEKDADRAATELGIAATCGFEGAAKDGQRPKWSRRHSEMLRGAKVLIIADNDDAGVAHARAAAADLTGIAAQVAVFRVAIDEPKADLSDHLDAGHGLEDLVPVDQATAPSPPATAPEARSLRVTRASAVTTRRTRWLWNGRVVLGGLTLVAGREGLGKSTVAVDVTASTTLGLLDGEFKGEPRTVIYINSEDARDYTIVPRLIAAGGDLDRVVFVDAVTRGEGGEAESPIVLPLDVDRLAHVVREHDAALVVLDAATSVIDSRLDGDRDRQMRQGLEAIARGVGEVTGCAVLGIVHFGKRESADTGKLILGSIAWSQVARSVLAVARDDESGDIIISTTKTNLGPGAPSLTARIISATVTTADGETSVGRVVWGGETDRDARDLLGVAESDQRADRDEAIEWLKDHLTENGGEAPAGKVIGAAVKAGFAKHTLQRARKKAGVSSRKASMGDGWVWALTPEGDTKVTKVTAHVHVAPSSPSVSPSAEDGVVSDASDATPPRAQNAGTTGPFGTTEADQRKQNANGSPSAQSCQSRHADTAGTTGCVAPENDDPGDEPRPAESTDDDSPPPTEGSTKGAKGAASKPPPSSPPSAPPSESEGESDSPAGPPSDPPHCCQWCQTPLPAGTPEDVVGHVECRPVKAA